MVGPPPNQLTNVCPIEYVEWVKSAMRLTYEFVFKHMGISAIRQKNNYDQGLKPRAFQVGNFVWRWYPPQAKQKFGLGWQGPYLVIKTISNLTYSVQKAANSPVVNVHVDHLIPYRGNALPMNWLEVEQEAPDQTVHSNEGDGLDIDPSDISIPDTPPRAQPGMAD